MSKITVQVWEHDRWSGVKLSHTRKYRHRRSAIRYRNQVNGENTAKITPEIYWTASIKGD